MLADLERRMHVWTAEPVRDPGAAWIAAAEGLLSADELARCRRLVRPADRDRFLSARMLVRTTLSRYHDIPPAEWSFRPGPHGRPEIANRGAPGGLRFSLAHTTDLLALLVHDGADGGVDVERLGRVASVPSVARSVLAAVERDELSALPGEHQEARFYRLWTLKEAFVKATGRGFSVPLQDFWFARPDDDPITLGCRDPGELEPATWTFTVWRPSDHHVLATAYRSGEGRPARHVEILPVMLS